MIFFQIWTIWSGDVEIDKDEEALLVTDRTSFRVFRLKRRLHCSPESTLVKIPNCWKSQVKAHFKNQNSGLREIKKT